MDCYGDSIIVRTSGYANFANKLLPEGNGTLIAIVSVYDSYDQLVIRSYDEVQLVNDRREVGNIGDVIFSENFNESWNDWERISVKGAQVWERENALGSEGSACAQITGWDNGSYENEDWLVSPPVDLSDYDFASIKFETATNFDGEKIMILIGIINDDNETEWLDITNNTRLSTGSFNWLNSGYYVIPTSYLEDFKHIAFLYKSDNILSSTWRIDNIEIKADNY